MRLYATWHRPRSPLRGRWVHLCFLDRECRRDGAPPRIYLRVIGLTIGWDDDRDAIPPG